MNETTRLDNIEQIIDFAIQREREAQDTYLSFARETQRRSFSELLLSMAAMEKEHERKLVELKQGRRGLESFTPTKEADLGLSDMLVAVPFSPTMDYGDFLILVIRKEREAETLYRKLESLTSSPDVKNMLHLLADEERKHRDWAQQRYDQDILKEN